MTPGSWPYPGARWWKFDFHTHTPHSTDTNAWQAAIGTPDEVTPEKWLRKFMELGFDCVAITDHNGGDWIDKLKQAYADMRERRPEGFRELCLFPGVELSVSGGFHIVALFDPSATSADIDRLLGAVDYAGKRGDANGVTRASPPHVVKRILDAGALAIPAHADGDKGLLEFRGDDATKLVHDANTVREVLADEGVIAMEWVHPEVPRPPLYVESRVRWTEVLGSDCHTFRGAGSPGSRYTWVKMAEPSLQGVRLALRDGKNFSVRRSDEPTGFDPATVPDNFIESIQISDARHMGRGEPETLRFTPWLNALVGGRGTGKSTIVHCTRLAFRREDELARFPDGSEARRTFERFNHAYKNRFEEGGLSAATTISVTLLRQGVRHRLVWKHNQAIEVQEHDGEAWRLSSGQAVTPERFPLRIFSQGQIAALAGESQDALMGVIDEHAAQRASKLTLDEERDRYCAVRAKIRELDGRLKGREQARLELGDVQRKLAGFEGTQHAEVLRDYQVRARQQREIDRHVSSATEIAQSIDDLVDGFAPELLAPELFDANSDIDKHGFALAGRLRTATDAAATALRAAAEALRGEVAAARSELDASTWASAAASAKAAYDALTTGLKGQGVSDPSEYQKLVEDRQRLDDKVAAFENLEQERVTLVQTSGAHRLAVRSARREVSAVRRTFLREVLAENQYVRIGLLSYQATMRVAEKAFRELLNAVDERFAKDILSLEDGEPRGLIADLFRGLPADADEAAAAIEDRLDVMASRLENACAGKGSFTAAFNKFLVSEAQKRPEMVDKLLMWSPEDALRVEHSPLGNGRDFTSIGQASDGQRAAAMLAFLLAHGTEPLVLDQPEDDLDNHLIYELVVRQLRANKLRRQITVVTHNPNVVVNGDAEMLHAFDFIAGQCRVEQSGSLQSKDIREEVCRVMEGGRVAFKQRYERLGRDL